MTFSLFGIPVEITFWFISFICFILSLDAPTNLIVTVISSLFHEIGHILMMLYVGNKPKKIRFELVGINIIRNQETAVSVKNEMLISLGGPLLNAMIVILCCIFLCFYEYEIIMTVACINLILMTFNLLPIKKLDGGTALYFFLSQKFDTIFASLIIKLTSIIFIALIFGWGFHVLALSKYNISLIIIAIFLTISMFCDNEY